MYLYLGLMVHIFISGIVITRYVTVSEKIKKFILFLFLCLPIFILTALRGPDVGNDTIVYRGLFYEFQEYGSFFENDSRFEIGFVVLSRFLSLFSNDPQIVLIVCAVITDFFIFRFIFKHSKMIWFSIFIFVGLRFMFFTMSGIRQAVSISILLFGYDFIVKRKPLKFYICLAIASLFHTAVFCCIPLYFISKFKFNMRLAGIITAMGMFVFLLFDQVLSLGLTVFPQYSAYVGGDLFGQFLFGNIILFIIQALLMMIGIVCGYCFTRGEPDKKITRLETGEFREKDFLSFTALISMLLCLLALRGSTLDRFYMYYQVFMMLFLPNAALNIKNTAKRSAVVLGIVLFLILYNAVIFTLRPEWLIVFPYKFFWNA